MARDGNELGNHTEHHCRANATGCAWGAYAGSLEAEYDLCSEHIEQSYGVRAVWTTASPYGDTGYDTVAQSRFFLNRGVQRGQVAPGDSSDAFNLPVYGAVAGDTAAVFNGCIDAAHAAGNWQIFLFHSFGQDHGYAPVQVAEVVASIEHAKSLGDVWIDSMENVGAYWMGERALAHAAIKKSGRNTILTWRLPPHFPPGKYLRVTVSGGRLTQQGRLLAWNDAGYYEVALDAGSLTIAP
jgi:hypothetical protein